MRKYIFFLFLPVMFFACGQDKKTELENVEEAQENLVSLSAKQLDNAQIETHPLEQKQISTKLKVNGKIDVPPQNLIAVSVPMGGFLQKTHLIEGMFIKKGETIAVMEDPQYIQIQQDFLTAKIRLNTLEKEFFRQKELNENKAGSDKVFENAQSDFLTQKVLIKALAEKMKLIGINPDKVNEQNLSRRINIISPINGFVLSVKTNIGKYVLPTETLFELVDPSDIHLALSIYEKDLNQIAIGQKLISFTNSAPQKIHNAKILLIGKDVSANRSVMVHCHFDQYDKTLIPGMYMNAEIETNTSNGYVIQNEGIVRFEGKLYVFEEVSTQKYEMQEVISHQSENGFTLITFQNELNPNGKIYVTKGAYSLLMMMKNKEE